MRPHRPSAFADAVPVVPVDGLLREAAPFYAGASDREVARQLRAALAKYCDGRWRRDRSEKPCLPPLMVGG